MREEEVERKIKKLEQIPHLQFEDKTGEDWLSH